MATTLRIRRRLDSVTLHLPELEALMGHDVEIVVRDAGSPLPEDPRYPLRGTVMAMDDPYEPVCPDDWEALRDDADDRMVIGPVVRRPSELEQTAESA